MQKMMAIEVINTVTMAEACNTLHPKDKVVNMAMQGHRAVLCIQVMLDHNMVI
jgi:hypothetical protein